MNERGIRLIIPCVCVLGVGGRWEGKGGASSGIRCISRQDLWKAKKQAKKCDDRMCVMIECWTGGFDP
jgi:hypothetical protein